MKLNLGAGHDIKQGYVNVDIAKLPGIDIVHDLNKFPYPFKENSVDEVYCASTMEHLDDFQKVMKELHRICRNGARVFIAVPYWNCLLTWADPQHKRGFTLDTFKFFENSHYYDFKFKVISQKIVPTRAGRLFPGPVRYFLSYFLCNIISGIDVTLETVKQTL